MASLLSSLTSARTPRVYAVALAVVLGLGLAAIGAINALVDPMSLIPGVGLDRLAPYRSLRTRTARAELVRRGEWETIVAGTSHAEVGLDPSHPSFPAATCNAALSMIGIGELDHVFRFILAHTEPRHLVVEVDFDGWTKLSQRADDFLQSRFNPDLLLIEYHCDNFLSLRASELSAAVLKRALEARPSEYAPDGHIRHKVLTGPQRAVFERLYLVNARARATTPPPPTDESVLDAGDAVISRLISACRQRDIRLDLVVLPVHAIELERYRREGRWALYEAWLTRLTLLAAPAARDHRIALWTFAGYNAWTTEPIPPITDTTSRMQWYWEQSHFTAALGNLVIDRIFSAADPANADFGVRLTDDTLPGFLRALSDARGAYLRANPDVSAWLDELDRRAGATPR